MSQVQPNVGAVPAFQFGVADRVVLIALRNVSTGDTLDLGATGMNLLATIERGVIISLTSFVEIAASWVGTVITMPAGLGSVQNGVQKGDAGYLLAWGSGIN
jgi:hypothetical protein